MDRTGEIFDGRYRLQRRLGHGGMAEVYAARDERLDKAVAVKVLSGECAALPRVARRFEQEARAASRIRHPSVVDVTDVGVAADGTPYLVMELLRGEDLAATLAREGPLPWGRVGPIALQICAALAAAHRAGVVHRDIKPSNCFRSDAAGERDIIKVLDFGIARIVDPDKRIGEPTTAGTVLGTPEYIAPEVAAGDPAGPRSDLYAVGALIYKLLTGVAPFTGGSFHAVLSKQIFEPPIPPRRRAPGRKIPADVEALVLRALAKEPGRRQADMAALAGEIAATFAGQPDAGAPSERSSAASADSLAAPDVDALSQARARSSEASTDALAPADGGSLSQARARSSEASTDSLAAVDGVRSTELAGARSSEASTDSLALPPLEPREPVTAVESLRRRGPALRPAVEAPQRRPWLLGVGAAAAALAGALVGVRLTLSGPEDMPRSAGAADQARSDMPDPSGPAPSPAAAPAKGEAQPPARSGSLAAEPARRGAQPPDVSLASDPAGLEVQRAAGRAEAVAAPSSPPVVVDTAASAAGPPASQDTAASPGAVSRAAQDTVAASPALRDMAQESGYRRRPAAGGLAAARSEPRPVGRVAPDPAPRFDVSAAARALDGAAAAVRACAIDSSMMRGEIRLRVAVDDVGRVAAVEAAAGARAVEPGALGCIRRELAGLRLAPVAGEVVHGFVL